MKIFNQISICMVALCSLAACQKSGSDSATPTGRIELHLHTNADTNEIDYNTVYTLTGGRKISVSLAQLYLSGIELQKADGTWYSLPGAIVLKVQETEPFAVNADVPVGNYQNIRFNVGLDAATNAITPTATDTALNRPEMWFGSTAQPAGYVFVNFQGSLDTTAKANSDKLLPFAYKLGTAANLKQVTMTAKNYAVTPGKVALIHLTIDYAKLFTGIVLSNPANLTVNTVPLNSSAVAARLAANIPLMFSYEY